MNRALLAGWAILLCVGCSNTDHHPDRTAATQVSTAAISLPNLKCKTCVKTVSGALEDLNGVEGVEVDLSAKQATVRFIAAKLDVGTIRGTISKAGYTADDVVRDSAAYEALPECCK